jgi:predicted RNase H-like HicB family nuclease
MTNILRVELEREVDGRWIAEAPALPGAIVYGASPENAVDAVRRLAADVIEDGKLHGEPGPDREAGAVALTMLMGRHVAAIVPGLVGDLLEGHVDGLPGAHTQAESLDELYRNLSEVIALVAGDDSASDNPGEERLSAREN